ncbi:hypothetical protein AWM75_00530 [Aerococcus urinaehominis]|uniref:Uncharacterized protein n=1 Tax=Aerococcus urinaehominis TaxID=128944 RepID=A0A0X8FJN6_9LACT|nr:lipocalin-like domain-containing protein [Aerococcus urinaehominis]AMB98568.1 hypothetical protein AWM75_00530 [Aerococcus urinaehominis]SDL77663.1 Lipocalin-like domain-containing protein [Aerococcus urinaehominis]
MSKVTAENIIGCWELVSYQSENEAGETIYPLGQDAQGYIMYTPDGYMSAQLMAPGRPAYASGDLHRGSQDEMAQAAAGYMAYTGPYDIDEDKQELTHHMTLSMNPTWLGQSQPRVVSLEGDLLKIYNGLKPADQLVWRRAGQHDVKEDK